MFFKIVISTLLALAPSIESQSNYAVRGINTNYLDEGLPSEAVLNGTVTQLDTLSDAIFTNRTTASLSCATRAMDISMEFKEAFFGIVYANFDRNAACSFIGNGSTKYELQLPLRGCGTIQDPQRVFTNNIVVRFHPSLELEGDEIKTIVCRYPTPTVIPPSPIEQPILQPAPPPVVPPPMPKLSEAGLILVFCAILFLGLLLLGIAGASYCVKRRNIKIVRLRRSPSLSSDTTKISTDLGTLPFFNGLKIPRAHTVDLSDMEDILNGTNGYPSDGAYPSDDISHEEAPGIVNAAYYREPTVLGSEYSDHFPDSDYSVVNDLTKTKRIFDVNVNVKRAQSVVSGTDYSDFSITRYPEVREKRISSRAVSEPEHTSTPAPSEYPSEYREASVFMGSNDVMEKERICRSGVEENISAGSTMADDILPIVPRQEADTVIHDADDLIDKKIVETRVYEDEEKIKRRTIEYYKKSNPNFNVKIRKAARPPSTMMESIVESDTENEETRFKSRTPSTVYSDKKQKRSQMVSLRDSVESTDDVVVKKTIINNEIEEVERLRKLAPSLKPDFDVNIKKHRTPSVYDESDVSDYEMSLSKPRVNIPPDFNVNIFRYPESSVYDESDASIYEPPEQMKNHMPSHSESNDNPFNQPNYRGPPNRSNPDFDVQIKKRPQSTNYDESDTDFDEKTSIKEEPGISQNQHIASLTSGESLTEYNPSFKVKIQKYHDPSIYNESETDWEQAPPITHKLNHVAEPKKTKEPSINLEEIDDSYIQKMESYKNIEDEERYRRVETFKMAPKNTRNVTEAQNPVLTDPTQPKFDVQIQRRQRTSSSAPDSVTTYITEHRTPSSVMEPKTFVAEDHFEPARPDFDVKIKKYSKTSSSIPDSKTTYFDQMEPFEEEPIKPEFNVNIKKYPKAPSSLQGSVTTYSEPSVTNWTEQFEEPIKPDFDVKIKKYQRAPSSIQDSVTTYMDRIKEYSERESEPADTDWNEQVEKTIKPDFDVKIKKYQRAPTSIQDSVITFMDQIKEYNEPEEPLTEEPEPSTEPARASFDVKIKKYPKAPSSVRESVASTQMDVFNPYDEPERPDFNVKIRKYLRAPSSVPESIASTNVEYQEDPGRLTQLSTECVDDTHIYNQTVSKFYEDEERIVKREITKRIKPPNWDVVIRKYPKTISERPESVTDLESIDSKQSPYETELNAHDVGILDLWKDMEMRSVGEDVVDYRQVEPDTISQYSGYTNKSSVYPRSMADRSHAETEIVEIPFLEIIKKDPTGSDDNPAELQELPGSSTRRIKAMGSPKSFQKMRSSRITERYYEERSQNFIYGRFRNTEPENISSGPTNDAGKSSIGKSLARSTSEFTVEWTPRLFEMVSDSESSKHADKYSESSDMAENRFFNRADSEESDNK